MTTLEAWLGKASTKNWSWRPGRDNFFFKVRTAWKRNQNIYSMFELLVNNHLTCLTCHFFLWKKNYRFILAKKPFAISQWHVTSLTISREEQCALPSLKTVASAHGTVAHHTTQSHCFNQSVAFGRGGKKNVWFLRVACLTGEQLKECLWYIFGIWPEPSNIFSICGGFKMSETGERSASLTSDFDDTRSFECHKPNTFPLRLFYRF